MLAGIALTLAICYALFTVQHHHATSPHPAPTLAQQRSRILEECDASIAKIANDTTLLPEVRIDALAAKVKADALFAVDTRNGTNETQIYAQQEAEHWERVKEALRHPHPERAQPEQIAWRESTELALDEAANDPRGALENRADALGTKRKFDALFALDVLLGTTETTIFLQQERDRAQPIVAAMEALSK
ncbi:MAG: hypothetical protein WA172_03375 [Terriglobales bacterium]